MRNISACRLGSLRLEVTATDVAACRTWAQAVSGTAPESAASAQMWLATVLVRTKDRREAMRLAGAALSELETHQASGLDTFRLTAAEILLEGGDTEGAESLLAELELRGPTPREQARLDFARGLAGVEPQSSRVLVTGARATLGRHPSLNRRRLAEIDAWLEANGR